MIKTPKVYIRDTGIIHCLLGIEGYNDLLGHPALGNSFEAIVISSILENFPRFDASFYRSSSGAEIDLILEKGCKKVAIEIKSSSALKLTQGFFEALKVVSPDKAFVVAQVDASFSLKNEIWVHSLETVLGMDL